MRKVFLAMAVFVLLGGFLLQATVMAQVGENTPCQTQGMHWSDQCGTGVGACEKGQRACLSTDKGTVWGPCEGGVAAVEEIPGNGLDDDCNGLVDEGGFNLVSLGLIGTGVVFMVVALVISRMS